jgi:starvation-inducible DNA-binding protein
MSKATTNPSTSKAADKKVAKDLQAALVELVDLALIGKQAHWNVTGPQFRSVHLELDEVVDLARLSSDRVAERLATIDVSPDGRARTIGSSSDLPSYPDGFVAATDTVQHVSATIDTIAVRMKERILRIGDDDPVSQDILIGISDELEKAGWMLRSQLTL